VGGDDLQEPNEFVVAEERGVQTREALALHNPAPAQSAAVRYLLSALSMPVCKGILNQDHLWILERKIGYLVSIL